MPLYRRVYPKWYEGTWKVSEQNNEGKIIDEGMDAND